MLKNIVKIKTIQICQFFLGIFCIFKLNKNKIFFCSFDGKQYSDSPKVISEEYCNHNSELKIVWAFEKEMLKKIELPNKVIKVKKGSLRFLYHFYTSKEIVVNDFISSCLKLRKKQILLNTWHGGGSFKTVGFTSPNASEYDVYFFKLHSKNTTAYVLSSEFFGEAVINKSFRFFGTVLKTGMPRNACLFEKCPERRKNVEHFFGIGSLDEYTVVLYAPTYRSDCLEEKNKNTIEKLDVMRCCNAIEMRFGKPVVFIYRAHHLMGDDNISDVCLDGTMYPDMQDLVYCCDALISDYSSCMWDFIIMKKPVFQFVPDLLEYINDRDFLLPIDQWNFIIAKSNDELETKIHTFNSALYLEGIERYLIKMKSYENSNSTGMVCAWLDAKREEK